MEKKRFKREKFCMLVYIPLIGPLIAYSVLYVRKSSEKKVKRTINISFLIGCVLVVPIFFLVFIIATSFEITKLQYLINLVIWIVFGYQFIRVYDNISNESNDSHS